MLFWAFSQHAQSPTTTSLKGENVQEDAPSLHYDPFRSSRPSDARVSRVST
jgi:hypothetical protein